MTINDLPAHASKRMVGVFHDERVFQGPGGPCSRRREHQATQGNGGAHGVKQASGLHGPYSEREVRIAHRVHGLFLKLLHGFLLGIHGADDERAGRHFPALFELALFLAQVAGIQARAFLRPFRGDGAGMFARAAADAQRGVQPGQAVFLAIPPDVGHRIKGLGGAMLRTGAAVHVLPGNQAAADVKPGYGDARGILRNFRGIPLRSNGQPANGSCGADFRAAVAVVQTILGGKSIRGFMNPFSPSCK